MLFIFIKVHSQSSMSIQLSMFTTNFNVTVHIKSAINVHTVVANIKDTVHIK